MGDITSANSAILVSIPQLFPIPQQLQGFAADDIFDIPAIESVETLMGVDGVLSAGFVFKPLPMEVTLQADSALNGFFDQWWTQMQATLSTFAANGVIRLPAISTKFTLSNGFLTSYKPTPAAKKLLQPRRYMITWNTIAPAPA
jgi:hypothetical protein